VNGTAAEHGDVFCTGEVLRWRNRALWGAHVETTAFAGFMIAGDFGEMLLVENPFSRIGEPKGIARTIGSNGQ
jgi:hypothetical protein